MHNNLWELKTIARLLFLGHNIADVKIWFKHICIDNIV